MLEWGGYLMGLSAGRYVSHPTLAFALINIKQSRHLTSNSSRVMPYWTLMMNTT